MKFITHSAKQTQKLGQALAQQLLRIRPRSKALVLGLQGDLGSGKTTFLQGFASGLGVKEKITSPTFVIMKRFSLNNKTAKQFHNFYHFDCYRLDKPEDLLGLGWEEIVKNPYNIVALEWPERVKKALSKMYLRLQFTFLNPKNRQIIINYKVIKEKENK
jgi:tRNA threonylcarbamoyladenosine biosynthesis protein TsaE